MSKKYVYLFSEGDANMRELLGGKGANLAEMTKIGLPVPQGLHNFHRGMHSVLRGRQTDQPRDPG